MAYGDDSLSNQWPKRLLGLVVGVIGYILVKALFAGGIASLFGGSVSRIEVERAISGNPDTAILFDELKSSYPDKYAEFLDTVVAQSKNGLTRAEARAHGAQFMRAFLVSKVPAISQASPAALRTIGRAQLDLTEQLNAESLQLCADFAMRGISPTADLSTTAIRKAAEVSAATIAAARAGESSPVNRTSGTLNDADAGAWAQAMLRTGGSERLLRAMANADAMSSRDQCDMGQVIFRAALALPEEQSARVIAYLIWEASRQPLPR